MHIQSIFYGLIARFRMLKQGYIQAAHLCAACLFKTVASFVFDSTTLRDRQEILLSVPTLSWPISSPLSEASSTALHCFRILIHSLGQCKS